MSGWTPMRNSLTQEPETVGIALALNMDPREVVGRLHAVWSAANEQTLKGLLPRWTRAHVDHLAGAQKFADAMAAHDWLRDIEGGGIELPRFAKYNRTLKGRLQARNRQKRKRVTDAKRNADVTRDMPVTSRTTGTYTYTYTGTGTENTTPLPPAEPGGGRTAAPPQSASAPVGRHAAGDGANAPWRRDADVREIIAAFPESAGGPSVKAVRHALYLLGGTSGEARFPSERDAAAWLIARVRSWAASRLCRSTPARFRPSMARWLDDAAYDTPDAAWDRDAPADDRDRGSPRVGDSDIDRIARGERVA